MKSVIRLKLALIPVAFILIVPAVALPLVGPRAHAQSPVQHIIYVLNLKEKHTFDSYTTSTLTIRTVSLYMLALMLAITLKLFLKLAISMSKQKDILTMATHS